MKINESATKIKAPFQQRGLYSYDTFRLVCASNAKAINIIIEKANKDEPPYEISGRGIPITGTRPIVIPTFIRVWIRKPAWRSV